MNQDWGDDPGLPFFSIVENDWATAALSFIPSDLDRASTGEFWDLFEDYLCTLALRYNGGTPMAGWGPSKMLSSYLN